MQTYGWRVCAYICYMRVIYMLYSLDILVYPWYIPCVCRPTAYYPWDITSLYLMGLFSTFFYNDMTKYIH